MDELQRQKTNRVFPELHQVSSLSKYFAILLFIALPFVGGWIGYQYAPFKIIEIELEQSIRTPSEQNQALESFQSVGTSSSMHITTYESKELGIAFEYPSSWGGIYIIQSQGTCSDDYTADDCRIHTLAIGDARHHDIVLATMTTGYHLHPVSRGGFWGDFSGSINEHYAQECVNNSACEIMNSEHNVLFARYYHPVPEMGDSKTSFEYRTYRPNHQYFGYIISPVRIQSPRLTGEVIDGIEKTFEETIVRSFRFIE